MKIPRSTGIVFWSLVVGGLFALFPARGSAGNPVFGDQVKFGTGRDASRSVITGDFDDDGDLDIAVGNDGGQDLVYLNDGAGGFLDGAPSGCAASSKTIRCLGDGSDRTTALATGDLDADGDLDLAAGYIGRQSRIYLNDGNGNFTMALPFGPEVAQTRSLALGDVDNDGDLDIALGTNDGSNAVYLNQGGARFFRGSRESCALESTDYRCFGGNRTESVALGDVNADAYLDIIVAANGDAGQGIQSAVYLNDGSGGFSSDPPAPCEEDETGGKLACFGAEAPPAAVRRVAAGDVDGDGDLDIIATFVRHPSALFLNDGAGRFTLSHTFGSPDAVTLGLTLADVNGDGAPDAVTGLLLGENTVHLNDGQGRFDRSDNRVSFGAGADATFAVASADLDDDGDLDLITGNYRKRNTVYLSDGAGTLPPSGKLGAADEAATSLFVGDVDWDGDLDIVTGGANQPNRAYLNDGKAAFPASRVFGETLEVNSIVLGNLDGDGDLDAVAAVRSQGVTVFSNYGTGAFDSGTEFGHPDAAAVALADVDMDGDLDIIAAHAGADVPGADLAAFDVEEDVPLSPASAGGVQSFIYLNDGAGRFGWAGAEKLLGNASAHMRAFAVGDLDGDGDPDIASGNNALQFGERNTIYLNDGAGNFGVDSGVTVLPGDPDNTNSIAMGDLDGDGDLDIAVGNGGPDGRRNFIFLNNGAATFAPGRSFGDDRFRTTHLALTDWDSDGDLDIINSFADAAAAVYLNDGGGSFPSSREVPAGALAAASAGDLDSDGDFDLVGVSRDGNAIVLNQSRQPSGLPNSSVSAYVVRPGADPDAERIASVFSVTQQRIPVRYGLYDPDGDGVRRVALQYSPVGGGHWRDAQASAGTVTTALPTQAAPSLEGQIAQTYRWETFDSGLADQNDSVTLRLKAYPDFRPVTGGVPDAQQWPYFAATTYPFRVTGRQIRVFSDTLKTENAVEGAYVLRLPRGQVAGAQPLSNPAGEPLLTDARGLLRGGGQILPGDRLFAMLPVRETPSFTVYHTSGAPTETGVQWRTVPLSGGSQELVVSAENPLILFHMDLSLEWDARNDEGFLEELEAAIRRSSEVLYDVSDGRMALGNVWLHQAKEAWLGADVVMYASNGVRPRASMGGVVDQPTSDVVSPTKTIADAFFPGQIRMGPIWDPFGESRSDLGQDWWRAFAHEFGHYYLYLPDNYLGYDEDGAVTAVDCIGSFMTTAYDDEYSEFLDESQWAEAGRNCWKTVAEQLTGRSDWETVQTFYPEVGEPGSNRGPSLLPLEVTQVFRMDPDSPARAMPARNIDLRDAVSGERLIVPRGYGYLFKTKSNTSPRDDEIIALGPTSKADHIKVRGASPGDRLCVFDHSEDPALIGCIDSMQGALTSIPMAEVPGWQPSIQVQPTEILLPTRTVTRSVSTSLELPNGASSVAASTSISSTAGIENSGIITASQPVTLTRVVTETIRMFQPALVISVTQPALSGRVNVQVVPAYGSPDGGGIVSPVTQLIPVGEVEAGVYTQIVPLDYPAYSGFVRIWVEGAQQEAISQFFVDPLTWDQWQSPTAFAAQGDLGPNSRGGLGPNSRGGLGPNSRGGLGPNSRGGLGPNSRGGLGPNSRGGLGPNSRGGLGADTRAWGANRRSFDAPIASADGQVTIFNSQNVLADTGTSSLLALPAVPGLPDWFTIVGQGYRFAAAQSAPRTIGFNYLQRDVPDGYEHTLRLYYSGDEGETWRQLETRLDSVENLATAPAEESGIYALIATVDIPVYVAGWNLFSYPVPESRPVAEALASVDGRYNTVYGYDSQDPANPWKVYNVDAPDWVNDLKTLEFGGGYWINASEPITLQLKVAAAISTTAVARPSGSVSAEAAAEVASGRRPPPAIYFGAVLPDADFAPAPGQPVTAWIGDALCGETITMADGDGGVRYSIKVAAAEISQAPVCGAPESEVILRIGDATMEPSIRWDNSQPREHALSRSTAGRQ